MTFLFGETVTLIRRTVTGKDSLGSDVYSSTETPAPGAVFAPGGSTENVQAAEQVVSDDRFIWVNTLPDVTAVDAIRRANGDTYEVTGAPANFPPVFTTTTVLEVHVRRVTG